MSDVVLKFGAAISHFEQIPSENGTGGQIKSVIWNG